MGGLDAFLASGEARRSRRGILSFRGYAGANEVRGRAGRGEPPKKGSYSQILIVKNDRFMVFFLIFFSIF